MKTGILLMNIGSPKSYNTSDVAEYLKTFLMDEDIITAPWIIRWLLVHCIIVPRRASYSAKNYKKVWTQQGSPLLVYTQNFAQKLSSLTQHSVKIGMRYSDPSVSQALEDFYAEGVQKILLVPLYPQWAQATTGSSLKEVKRLLGEKKFSFQCVEMPPFYSHSFFIAAFLNSFKKNPISVDSKTHFLFSFHGLPEKQVKKVKGCLSNPNCCLEENSCKKNCYRAQCFKTADLIAQELQLEKNQFSVSFQSRLGPTKWIQPYTDDVVKKLTASGVKKLVVLCPSFVADCIETLEEIGIGLKEDFFNQGGESFHLISCPNDDTEWVQSFAQHCEAFI